MESKPQTEEILTGIFTPASVNRDDVREWVLNEQRRGRQRRRRTTTVALLVFLVTTAGIWISLKNQANQVRQLVDATPSKAIVALEEIMMELSGSAPPDYFVEQLKRKGKAPRFFSFSPTNF